MTKASFNLETATRVVKATLHVEEWMRLKHPRQMYGQSLVSEDGEAMPVGLHQGDIFQMMTDTQTGWGPAFFGA